VQLVLLMPRLRLMRLPLLLFKLGNDKYTHKHTHFCKMYNRFIFSFMYGCKETRVKEGEGELVYSLSASIFFLRYIVVFSSASLC
jgi:hypothetical protein